MKSLPLGTSSFSTLRENNEIYVAETDALLNRAIAQMQARHYGEKADNKELIRMALIFDSEKRRFTAWEVL